MTETKVPDKTKGNVTQDDQSAPASDTSSDDDNQNKGSDQGGDAGSNKIDGDKFANDGDKQGGDNADDQNNNSDDNSQNAQQGQDDGGEGSDDNNNPDDQGDEGGDQADKQFSWDDLEDEGGDGGNAGDGNTDIYKPENDINDNQDRTDNKQDKRGSDDTNQPSGDNNQDQDQNQEEPWKKVATDMGIEAADYTDFLSKAKTSQTVAATDDTIARLDSLLQIGDEEALIRTVMKDNDEYSDDDINEYVDNAKSQGNLKFEAKNIKGDLKRQKKQYTEYVKNQQTQASAKRTETAKQFESNLKEKLSKTETILKGRIGDKDRKDLYSHITTGKFQDSVVGDVERLIKLAWFDLNEDKVMKIMEGKGISKGKQEFLNNLSSTRSGAGVGSPVDMGNAKKGFDPQKWLADTPAAK